MRASSITLLASREDVWSFLSEPYHLSDWWPGITGVEPDLRGFAEGARWRVRVVDSPMPLALLFLRLPRMGRPSGRTSESTLVIKTIQLYERWAWDLVTHGRGDRSSKTLSVEVGLRYLDRARTEAAINVSGWGATPGLAEQAAKRLYDLVQTAATL